MTIIENKDTLPLSSLTNSKIIVSKLPKALIIKLEDVSPHEVYTQMQKKSITKGNDQLSDWYINNRHHCVNYIRKCCDRFRLRDNTFFASLLYADKVLKSSNKLSLKHYDIIIISCIVLATKYAENDAFELDLNDFHTLEGNSLYNLHEIKSREVITIKEIQYDLNISTAYDYLLCQMACGVIFKDEFPDKANVNQFYSYSKNILFQVISTNLGLIYHPEVIAICIITVSRKYFNLNKNRMNNIKDKLHFTQNDKYHQCLHDISMIIDINSSFFKKTDNKKQLIKKVKAKKPLYLSNPEVISQVKKNYLRNRLQITPRTINAIKVKTIENKNKQKPYNLNSNANSKQKPLDSTCSTIKPDSCSIFDSSKGAVTSMIVKPQSMSSNELFSFKTKCLSYGNSKLFTNCNLPIISARK